MGKEPEIIQTEIEKALKEIANNKAPGLDNLPIELLKATNEESIRILTRMIGKIWDSLGWYHWVWPEDWKRSVYIPIPKKGDPHICENNRTIDLN